MGVDYFEAEVVAVPQNEPETPLADSLRVYDKDFNLLYQSDDPDDVFELVIVVDSPQGKRCGRVESVIWSNALIRTSL